MTGYSDSMQQLSHHVNALLWMAPYGMWHLLGKPWLPASFSHTSIEFAWAPDHITLCATPNSQPLEHGERRITNSYSSNTGQCRRKICLTWNNYQYSGCPFPNCSFEHSCAYCINPALWTKDTRQDFVHIKTWQNSSMAHPTTTKSHTNLKLRTCVYVQGLVLLIYFKSKSYFFFYEFWFNNCTKVPHV